MYKKSKKIVMLLGLTVLVLTGCSRQGTGEIETLQQQLNVLEEENKTLREQMETLQTEVEALTIENNKLLDEMQGITKNEYIMYTRDLDSWEIVELETLKVDKNLNLKETIQEIANQISEKEFNNLPIEVKDLKEVNGDTIAVISLNEDESNEKKWIEDYFQGSAGGQITSTILVETFLQKQLTTEWIDGIQLLYNGEEQLMEHMELGNIIYR